MRRYTSQVSAAETTAAVSAPSFASASCTPVKARSAISRATVKPTPASVPLPSTAAQPTGGRNRPPLSRVTTAEVATIATGLPRTYPASTPSVIGAVNAARRNDPRSSMPAFASANSGTITKLVSGCNTACIRSFNDRLEVIPALAVRASCGVGCSRNRRTCSVAFSSWPRAGVYADADRPSTPLANSAAHRLTPNVT